METHASDGMHQKAVQPSPHLGRIHAAGLALAVESPYAAVQTLPTHYAEYTLQELEHQKSEDKYQYIKLQ